MLILLLPISDAIKRIPNGKCKKAEAILNIRSAAAASSAWLFDGDGSFNCKQLYINCDSVWHRPSITTWPCYVSYICCSTFESDLWPSFPHDRLNAQKSMPIGKVSSKCKLWSTGSNSKGPISPVNTLINELCFTNIRNNRTGLGSSSI